MQLPCSHCRFINIEGNRLRVASRSVHGECTRQPPARIMPEMDVLNTQCSVQAKTAIVMIKAIGPNLPAELAIADFACVKARTGRPTIFPIDTGQDSNTIQIQHIFAEYQDHSSH